jgi:hypothetical protein
LVIYAIFFAIEVVGMAMILWDGVPIFRQMVQFHQATTGTDEIILLIATAMVQFAYWKCLRHDPQFDVPRQQLAAHVVLFAGRLSFIFATSIFSFVVYRYSDVFDLSPRKVLLMTAVLFSVFCFSRHIEKIGSLMLTGRKAS